MPINFRLELFEWLKTTRIKRQDELSCVGDLVRFGIEVDAIATEQRAIERARK